MYKKYFFIGLGGSGGKTLRFLKRDLRKWLDENGAEDSELPAAWQFLHIDTPTAVDGSGLNPNLVPMLKEDEYLGLVSAGVNYAQVQAMLDNDESMHDEIQTWRVEPAAIGVPIGQGAGQFRGIGKTIATAYLPVIKARIEQSVSRMKNAQNVSELAQLYSKLNKDPVKADSNIVFVIISSLAGGTGAGLLFPVSDLIRGIDAVAGGDSIGLLYTPEVFSSIGEVMTGGVQANSLAAISELLNGYWWGGAPQLATGAEGGKGSSIVDPKTSASLRRAGVPFAIDRSGPAYPFVIGKTGASGVTFGTPEDLFENVGRTLVSWLVDPAVSSELIEFTIGNWENASSTHKQNDVLVDAPENIGVKLAHETGAPNLSGLGFSRLGVGTDWFERYSSKRLAFDALTVVVRSHMDHPEAQRIAKQLNTQDPDEVSNEWAESLLLEFLDRCGLRELGPNHNQIQDALLPKETSTLKSAAQQAAFSLTGMDSGDTARGSEWRSRLEAGVRMGLEGFEKDYDSALKQRIEQWVTKEISDNVLMAVERQVAICGLKTTAAIIRLTARHLKNDVASELAEHDFLRYQGWYQSWASQLNELNSIKGNIQSSDPVLQRVLEESLLYGLHYAEGEVARYAALLLPDFADGFLTPLSEALENGQTNATASLDGLDGWPSWDELSPPKTVCPPASEYTLIMEANYSALFERLLQESVGEDQASRETVRAEVISGDFLRDQVTKNVRQKKDISHLFFVDVKKSWRPSSAVLSIGMESSSRAQFRMRATSDDFNDRAKEWLYKPMSPFAELLNCSLRSYLGEDNNYGTGKISEQVYLERQSVFMAQFRAAFNAASPLVNINSQLLSAVHPGTTGSKNIRKIFSQIPLQGHPAMEQKMTEALKAMSVDDGIIEKLMTNSNKIKYIDISSILWPPHSALTIDSLMRPIAADWHKAEQSGAVPAFWLRRRATRLQEFIPVPQAVLVSMIRGWYVAGFMGLLDRSKGTKSHVIRVATGPEGIYQFPSPFLSSSGDHDDHLALVLESLSLAYVECSVVGSLSPLKPYQRLRDLGRNGDGSMYEYNSLGNTFSEFLRTGESPYCIPNVKMKVTGDTVLERIAKAESLLTEHQLSLNEKTDAITEKRRLAPTNLSNPPLFTGLMVPIRKALNDLLRAIREEGVGPENEDEL